MMKLPEGWPTEEMIEAGRNTPLAGKDDEDAPEDYRAVFSAMYEAAPTPPAQEAEPVYQLMRKEGWDWDTVSLAVYERSKDMAMAGRRILYTRPDQSELVRAAEEASLLLSDLRDEFRGQKGIWYAIKRTTDKLVKAIELAEKDAQEGK